MESLSIEKRTPKRGYVVCVCGCTILNLIMEYFPLQGFMYFILIILLVAPIYHIHVIPYFLDSWALLTVLRFNLITACGCLTKVDRLLLYESNPSQ